MTTLFRPVGLDELSLIWDSQMREFPPRLPHQPIFYPVAHRDYRLQVDLWTSIKLDANRDQAGGCGAWYGRWSLHSDRYTQQV